MHNFFQKGNLIALRELALRRMADRVDDQMQVYRRDACHCRDLANDRAPPGLRQPQSAGGTAGARGTAHGGTAAGRVAGGLCGNPGHLRLPEADRDRVVQTLRLAEQLGAETVTLSGQKVSEEILTYARTRNVSKIVVGKPKILAGGTESSVRWWTNWCGAATKSTCT